MELARGDEEVVDAIRVAVRVRPLNARELSQKADSPLEWLVEKSEVTQLMGGKPVSANSFSFDHVFDQTANNAQVFENLAKPVVHAALEGYNATIFAYGQTSSGKTHSMLGSASDPGVTRRAVQEVFETVRRTTEREFLLRASYIEIYQEIIRDLLVPSHDNLKIHEDFNRRVYVESREEVVSSVDEVMNMIVDGESARAVGETQMNERSSRSHTIFTILIESRARRASRSSDEKQDESEQPHDEGIAVRASTLSLVDLAGSERAALTGAEGVRLKEGSHINKSLLTLGNVINKLSSGEPGASAHVPYRDSKLTRILQSALGGNARTAILCAVTPAAMHMEETLSTLKFASRAKKVKNRTQCNEFLDDTAKLRRSERQIEHLKAQLSSVQARLLAGNTSSEASIVNPAAVSSPTTIENMTRMRIKAFEQKFEELCRNSESQGSVWQPGSSASAIGDECISTVSNQNSASSDQKPTSHRNEGHGDQRRTAPARRGRVLEVTASEAANRSRDALDLAFSCEGRRSSANSGQKRADQVKNEHDVEVANLRRAVFEAERTKQRTLAEIECERRAMNAEVEALAEAAEDAHRMRAMTEQQYAEAMSKLAVAEASSLVGEIVSSAILRSESRHDMEEARNQFLRLEALEFQSQHLAEEKKILEQQVAELRAREKRGVGPLLKEKNLLSEKLSEMEKKMKTVKQLASKTATEKAGIEKDIISRDRQIKVLESELDKRRKHENMSHSRADKEVAAERKKSEDMRSELTSAISEITRKNEELSLKLREAECDLCQKDNSISDLKASVFALERRGEELESQRADLSENLQLTNESSEELRANLLNAEERAKKAIAEVDELGVETANVHLRLEEARAELAMLLSSQKEDRHEISRLEQCVTDCTLRSESYRLEVDVQTAARAESERQATGCRDEIALLQRQLKAAGSRIDEAAVKHQSAETSLREKEAQVSASKIQFDSEMFQMKERVEALENELLVVRDELVIERSRTRELELTSVKLQDELDRAREEIKVASVEDSEQLTREREAHSRLEAALEENRKRSNEMENRYAKELAVALHEAEAERSTAKVELNALNSRASKAVQDLRAAHEELAATKAELSLVNAELSANGDSSEIKSQLVAELETSRKEYCERESRFCRELTAARRETEIAVASASSLSMRIDEMQNSFCPECETLRARVDELQEIQKTVSRELANYKTSVKESGLAFEAENVRLTSELLDKSAAHAKDFEKLSEVLGKLYYRDNRIADLEAKLREYRLNGGAIQKLERKLERRQHALHEMNALVSKQADVIAGMNISEQWLAIERMTRMECENEALRSSLVAREEKIAVLEQNEVAGQLERQKLRQEIKARDLARGKAKAATLQASVELSRIQQQSAREIVDNLANEQGEVN